MKTFFKTILLFYVAVLLPMVIAAAELKYDIALRDSILANVTGASVSRNRVSILRYGAKGDGVTDCRSAFEKAMKEAEKKGGIQITVPAGVYFMDGPLSLKSNVCIDLEEGAVLKFTPDPKKYPVVDTSWEGTYLHNYSPFIYGYGLHDVAIVGKGTIDGNAMATFATWKPKQKPAQMRSRDMNHSGMQISERMFGEGDWLRPHLIQFYDCRNITLEGVRIINSPFWCVHLLRSENVICRSLRYDAKLVNNDGIDPESSRNILIEDIYFDNGDDNIAIKSGRDNDGWSADSPSENIVIRNCHFKGLHAVVIGSEMSGGVRNVFIEDCDYAGYCKRGIYIKTNPDRGGYVKNLYVRNCRFDEVEDLFYVTSKYAGEGLDNDHFSEIENIYVNGLNCNRALQAALVLQGTKQKPISNVFFDSIYVGDAEIGVSFSNTENVSVGECHIGGMVDVPTQVTSKDNLFNR
ncbi:MAG: glycoside hydrolase family 28 protein [Muribaculaceae bacterium]|nr:glycoside hydrolase family 28 protein [Muribaculaceae bacterium]